MKQIVVISGKGGTGKTVLTASLAALSKKAVFADCDVDAADLHLLLNIEIKERHSFKSGKTAKINKDLCTQCGRCMEACRFNAITGDFRVDGISCEGCGVCELVCPAGAVTMEENVCGEWYISGTKYGPMVHARLGIAEENSGKLVTLVKQKAAKIAESEKRDYLIVDGPPGIGCPVIASLAGADLALIVTEPTLSGIHDMERAADLAKHFKIEAKVAINKSDINPENSETISGICKDRKIEVVARLPFSEEVPRSIVACKTMVEFCAGSDIVEKIRGLWQNIK